MPALPGAAEAPAGPFPLFLAGTPGLEALLALEARRLGFADAASAPGGVALAGDWAAVRRANLWLRGATRVLVRIAGFGAPHLAMLDKRARRIDWGAVLRADVPVSVQATSRRSRIYHAGAAAARVAQAIADTLGAPILKTPGAEGAVGDDGAEPAARILVRLDEDFCTVSLDTSGPPLHRRGTKQAVAKAPLRETLAAGLLAAAGYDGRGTVLDPMCGSGTLVLEAAGIAAGAAPGAHRAFAFQHLACHDPDAWAAALAEAAPARPPRDVRCIGYDRDAGAVAAASANAARAGLAVWTRFATQPVSALAPPAGSECGLVIVNPPYGARIGDRASLAPLYAALGRTLAGRFAGWRAALVTSDAGLAAATGLPFGPPGPPIPHGPLKIRLWQARIG
ncbi:MAG: class I SAM-dependent RNA methyltransferase [Pseudomonadota bacterium]